MLLGKSVATHLGNMCWPDVVSLLIVDKLFNLASVSSRYCKERMFPCAGTCGLKNCSASMGIMRRKILFWTIMEVYFKVMTTLKVCCTD